MHASLVAAAGDEPGHKIRCQARRLSQRHAQSQEIFRVHSAHIRGDWSRLNESVNKSILRRGQLILRIDLLYANNRLESSWGSSDLANI
jgi:hypothetical protein